MNEHIHHHGGRRGRSPLSGGRRRGGLEGGDVRFGRGRMRRGDVRSALLIALLDGPGHGYELIQALETKSEGAWRPSPGSVYPTLQMLADEGLVTYSEQDGKRVFAITDAGRTEANERVATQGYPWAAGPGEHGGLRVAMRDLHLAAKQVALTGSPDAVRRATESLTDTRKALYRLLAES